MFTRRRSRTWRVWHGISIGNDHICSNTGDVHSKQSATIDNPTKIWEVLSRYFTVNVNFYRHHGAVCFQKCWLILVTVMSYDVRTKALLTRTDAYFSNRCQCCGWCCRRCISAATVGLVHTWSCIMSTRQFQREKNASGGWLVLESWDLHWRQRWPAPETIASGQTNALSRHQSKRRILEN